MQDFLGLPLEVGDYVFGGTTPRLYTIVKDDPIDGYAHITELGGSISRKVFLNQYVRISKEQLTVYFMQKGYRS